MTPKAKQFLYRWIPRRVHQAYAWFGAYFWLPCKNCGEPFGGHEIPEPAADIPQPDRPGYGWVVCPMCTIQTIKGRTIVLPLPEEKRYAP